VRCGSRRRLRGYEAKGSRRRPMDRHLPPLTCLSYKSSSALSLSRQPLRGGGIVRCCKKAAPRQTRYTWSGKRTMSVVLYLAEVPPRVVARMLFGTGQPRLSINRQPQISLPRCWSRAPIVRSSRLLRLAPSSSGNPPSTLARPPALPLQDAHRKAHWPASLPLNG
jgi:hypothetical protein